MKFIKQKICLVSTVKNPGPSFRSFLKYHLKIDFDQIFIFFDDPKDPAIEVARKIPGVRWILCDEKYRKKIRKLNQYKKWKQVFDKDIITRQQINVDMAVGLAIKQGFDWIFHIDCDEIIYNSSKKSVHSILSEIPENIEQIICYNNESVPMSMDIENPFLEVTLFKKNNYFLEGKPKSKSLINKYFPTQDYFIFYKNGKAGARITKGLVSNSVHRFWNESPDRFWDDKANLKTSIAKSLKVYHYPICGFDRYLTKIHNLNNFGDYHFKNLDQFLSKQNLFGDFLNFVNTKQHLKLSFLDKEKTNTTDVKDVDSFYERYNQKLDFYTKSKTAYKAFDFQRLASLYKKHIAFYDDKSKIQKLLKSGLMEKNSKIAKIIKNFR